MEELNLKKLAKILNYCKNNGVLSLEYGDLKISMAPPEKQVMTPVPQARGSAKQAERIEEQANVQSQFDEAREDLSTLHVEDPVLFEKLQLQGELSEGQEN